MADIIDQGLSYVSGGGSHIGTIMIIIAIIIIVGIIAGFVTYIFVTRMMYKKNIVKFEKINGIFQPVLRDKGKIINLNKRGDQGLLLRKSKKLLPLPTMQTGINTYWYFESKDGEWINFTPGDFDVDRKEMGAKFTDQAVRLARGSLDIFNKERYDKMTFMEKYGGMIAYAVLILVTVVAIFLLSGKLIDLTSQLGGVADNVAKLVEQANKMLSSLDNIQSGGSGFTQALWLALF